MDQDMQDETPLLIRHPLQHNQKAVTPIVLVNSPEADARSDGSDSDTDLEVMSVGSVAEGEAVGGVDDDDNTPDTQQVDPRPLAGLIVFVEVRSGTDSCENRQAAIAHQLELLGATVTQRITRDVTHMVFKDGKQSTKEKAEKKGIYLVSPLWLDACKRANDRVSEAKYPVLCKDGSDSPMVLGRIKRMKSMQPKPLVEEITRSLERSRKRHRTNTPIKATPVHQRPTQRNCSTDEDNYELPEIRLPGTPLSKLRNTVSTPEGSPNLFEKGFTHKKTPNAHTPATGTGSTEANTKSTPSSASGTGSTKANTKSTLSSASGTGSTEANMKSTPLTGTGSTDTNTKNTSSSSMVKGSSRKNVTTADCGKVSSKKKTKSDPQSKKQHQPTAKATDDPAKKTGKRSHPSNIVAKTTKDPLQPIKVNQKAEDEVAPKPKKKKVRIQRRSFEKQLPTLVLTSVHTSDQEMVHSIMERLGQFHCVKTVCESTSHVVCGSPRRTVNVLSAILRGCWIVSLDWVMKSLECGSWVSEEPYEMTSSFPAAKYYRLQRNASFAMYHPGLFRGCGSVFLASGTSPPTQQLETLLTLGGGKVTTSHRKADVCVGSKSWSNTVKSVSEQWILDSISAHSLLSVEDYLLDAPTTREASPEL
ncbi:microcephalin-like isoform X2 [Halichondria panicea]|uniref:microcephalin-like isoform X2 n=1 Tax=Halichondria panicea TaxID=6063 RepID=UPI00312BBA91